MGEHPVLCSFIPSFASASLRLRGDLFLRSAPLVSRRAAVLAPIGGAPIHAGLGMDHDCLRAAEPTVPECRRLVLDGVAAARQLGGDVCIDAPFERNAGALEIVGAWGSDGLLHVETGVDQMRDDLHVSLCLHVSAHDAERDQWATVAE